MWEDRYDYIPTQEPIIVPELAYVPEYMPWFRIHGKPYLLSPEERQRPIAGWSQWPGSSPFSTTPIGPPMYKPSSQEESQEGPSGSSSFYQTPSPYRFQTPSPLVMQTPSHSLFYQGGLSSQHRQPNPLPDEPKSSPEQPQPSPKAGQRRNPARNRRRPPCGTESDGHRD
ncbi:hypothetical protein Gogos_021258 [Gossypium gossypioides]|uniref:Uncharacterized protein n=1 Tax=Gossypium gossypioides TaxID=34282 RepID=A0A7J9CXE7_GOSGO|nr:hypothetical protein [Gossypium gossypioides]